MAGWLSARRRRWPAGSTGGIFRRPVVTQLREIARYDTVADLLGEPARSPPSCRGHHPDDVRVPFSEFGRALRRARRSPAVRRQTLTAGLDVDDDQSSTGGSSGGKADDPAAGTIATPAMRRPWRSCATGRRDSKVFLLRRVPRDGVRRGADPCFPARRGRRRRHRPAVGGTGLPIGGPKYATSPVARRMLVVAAVRKRSKNAGYCSRLRPTAGPRA